MNLFKIPDKFKSHPDYPYRLHIMNTAESFQCPVHKETACFHDFGKLHNKFQYFISNIEKSGKTTHAAEGAFYYLLTKRKINNRTFPVFFSILKHHGNLEDVNKLILKQYSDEDLINAIYRRIREICISLNIQPPDEDDIESIIELLDTDKFVQDHKLKGLETYFAVKSVFSKLIFADKHEAIFKAAYAENTEPPAADYIRKLKSFIESKTNSMSDIRNKARNEIISNYKKQPEKRIFIIEAPTGLGKTFTALNLALEICSDKNKKKIICALPITSIIDQTFEEYGHIINNKDLVKIHHLTSAKNYGETDSQYYSKESIRQKNDYLSSSWCFDKIIITTFNQLLYAILSNKNRDIIKFWTLKDSVIIIDEVQAIPRVLLKDISLIIKYLSVSFNIDFILMSATIPDIKINFKPEETGELLDNAYYSMSFCNRYTLHLDKSINTKETLTNKITELSDRFNSVLCVVNTKKLCLQIYESLEQSGDFKDDELYMLNTNHIPKHRKEIIEILKERLKNKQKTILISTQVIEAGVDLDFDTGIREFAPLASIIQTAGRVNREGRKNNAGILITDRIGASPYNIKDLLYNEVSDLLKDDVPESNILPFLKKYFEIATRKTSPDFQLIPDMEELNFETVFSEFNDRFMKDLPDNIPFFIETENGLFDKFNTEHTILNEKMSKAKNLTEKMELKSEMHELNKKVSSYTINIRYNDIKNFGEFYPESIMRWCPFTYVESGSKYSFKKGWFGGYDEVYL